MAAMQFGDSFRSIQWTIVTAAVVVFTSEEDATQRLTVMKLRMARFLRTPNGDIIETLIWQLNLSAVLMAAASVIAEILLREGLEPNITVPWSEIAAELKKLPPSVSTIRLCSTRTMTCPGFHQRLHAVQFEHAGKSVAVPRCVPRKTIRSRTRRALMKN